MSRSPPLPYVPLDCVLEIARHVPTATRAAMACVCRDWKHALDGPSFAWHTLDLTRLPPLHRQPLPPSLAARLPAVRALGIGVRHPVAIRGVPHVNPSDVRPLLRATSGLTSLYVMAAPADVAPVAADAAAACPGLAALSLSVAIGGLHHDRFLEWTSLEPLTALTRLSRLRVAVERALQGGALPRLRALRAVTLELHNTAAANVPEFQASAWLANNAAHLGSLDMHVSGNVPPSMTGTLGVTRLRVTGLDPSAGLAPWLASMTRLVDVQWECVPTTRWADTVDTRGRLETCAPRLTRLVLADFPAHVIRLHQVPMPRLRVLQFRRFRPRLRGLALPPITTTAPALRVLVIGLSSNAPTEVIDLAPLLHRGLRELRTLVLEHAAVTASRPAQPGDAVRRAFPNLRILHTHACRAADVRGMQVLEALRDEADRTCIGPCPLDFRHGGWG